MKANEVKDHLIIALDTSSEDEARKYIDLLSEYTGYFKVGLELFTSVGPKIIKVIKDKGNKVFFDWKFLDIPNTVSHAVANMVRHKVDMINVYMSGGAVMLAETKKLMFETAKECNIEPPSLLGVTVLTSITNNILQEDLKIKSQLDEYVLHLASIALSNNMDGIICSPNEASLIKTLKNEKYGADRKFLIVTPGIRPKWASADDQKRTATPKEAIQNGATHIVVGRPVTADKNPKDAIKKILDEIESS